MAKKYETVKLGLPAYITFLAFIVAIVVMVLILIPSNKKKVRKMFQGSYTKEASQQGQSAETNYYDIGEDHFIKTCSFSDLKKQIKKDKYTYILYGDSSSTDFCLSAIEVNEKAKEINEKNEGKKIYIYYVDSKSATDKQKEYLRSYLKKINTDAKSIEKMPQIDLWVMKNNELIDCYSNPAYTEENLSIKMVSQYHIFSYRNK